MVNFNNILKIINIKINVQSNKPLNCCEYGKQNFTIITQKKDYEKFAGISEKCKLIE